MKNAYLGLFVLSLAVTAGCSKIKKLEGMSDTTSSMKDTTERMAHTTDKLEEDSSETYPLVKSASSQETRQRQFQLVKSPDLGLKQRCNEAAVYYRAFEYQVAGSRVYHEQFNKVEDFLADAANEYTRLMGDLYETVNTRKMSPLNSGKKHAKDMAFYSMAAAMHEVHNHHKSVAEKLNIPQLSFYNMVTESLSLEANPKLKKYQRILVSGVNREIMVELLKARVDMITAVGLSYLVDKRMMSTGGKMQALIYKLTGGKKGELKVPTTINEANSSTKETASEALEKAIETHEFLKSIGIEKKLHRDLKEVLSNIELKASEEKDDDEDLSIIRNQIEQLISE